MVSVFEFHGNFYRIPSGWDAFVIDGVTFRRTERGWTVVNRTQLTKA